MPAYAAILKSSVADVVRQQRQVGRGRRQRRRVRQVELDRLPDRAARRLRAATCAAKVSEACAARTSASSPTSTPRRRRTGTMWYRPDGRLRTPTAPCSGSAAGPSPTPASPHCSATSTTSRPRSTGVKVDRGVHAGRRAGQRRARAASTSSIPPKRSTSTPSPKRSRWSTHTIVDAGLLLQVDDAFIPYNYDRLAVVACRWTTTSTTASSASTR